MPKDTKLYDALHTRLGEEQYCPKCGGHNPSGKKLPDECVWCSMFDELPKADLSKGWDAHQQDLPTRLWELAEEMENIVSEIPRKDPDDNFMQMAMFAKKLAAELEKEM